MLIAKLQRAPNGNDAMRASAILELHRDAPRDVGPTHRAAMMEISPESSRLRVAFQ